MSAPHLLKREKVEHILRAAGRITGQRRFVLIGSAAVAAWREMLPVELIMSRDIDLFAFDVPDAEAISDQLDGAIGQASDFDQTFGYYCDGVGPETARLPSDWRSRAMEFSNANTEGVVALVPEPNDIALSKLYAWRPKDIRWLRAAARNSVIDASQMRSRLALLTSDAAELTLLGERLGTLARGSA